MVRFRHRSLPVPWTVETVAVMPSRSKRAPRAGLWGEGRGTLAMLAERTKGCPEGDWVSDSCVLGFLSA